MKQIIDKKFPNLFFEGEFITISMLDSSTILLHFDNDIFIKLPVDDFENVVEDFKDFSFSQEKLSE